MNVFWSELKSNLEDVPWWVWVVGIIFFIVFLMVQAGLIAWLWIWIIPDIFAEGIKQGIVPSSLAPSATLKMAIAFDVLLGVSKLKVWLSSHKREPVPFKSEPIKPPPTRW